MYMFPIFLLIVFIMVRVNTTYHPHLLFKRYIIIKNKTVSKLLIDQSDPANPRTKNAKANRNKLTYAGIVFYSFFFLLVCFSVIMALIPDISCKNFVYESRYIYLEGATLNQKLPYIFALTLLFLGAGFYLINTSKCAIEKTSAKRFVRVLYYFSAILFYVGAIGGIWTAITAILEVI